MCLFVNRPRGHPLDSPRRAGLRHLRAAALRQRRYEALLLDGDAVEPGALQTYEDSSFHQLWQPRRRWAFVDYGTCLESTGGLADKPKGRALYRDYLRLLCMDDSEQRRLGFDEMCSGWAKEPKEFKKAVLADQKDSVARKAVEAEASETREPRWGRGFVESPGVAGSRGA